MNKPLIKDTIRQVWATKSRFFSILAIIALGCGFFAGVKAACPDMLLTAKEYYREYNLADIHMMSTLGFDKESIEEIKADPDVRTIYGGYSSDVYLPIGNNANMSVKLMSIDGETNLPQLIDGRMPTAPNECLVELTARTDDKYKIGDTLTFTSGKKDTPLSDVLKYDTYTIVGSVRSPLYIGFERGTTDLGNGTLDTYVLLPPEAFAYEVYTDVFLTLNSTVGIAPYTDEYDSAVESAIDRFEKMGDETLLVNRADRALSDAEKQLSDGKQELSDGEKEYADGKEEFDREIADAEKKLADGRAELEDGRRDLEDGKAKYQDGLKEYNDGVKELSDAKREFAEKIAEAEETLSDARSRLDDGWAEYNDGLAEYETAKADYEKQIADGEAELSDGRAQYEEQLLQYEQAKKSYADGYAAYNKGMEQYVAAEAQYNSAYEIYAQAEAAYKAIEELVNSLPPVGLIGALQQQLQNAGAALNAAGVQLNSAKAQLDSAKQQLDEGAAQFAGAEAQFKMAEEEFAKAEEKLRDGEAELEKGRKEGEEKLSEAKATLDDALKELQNGEAEYNDGVAEYEKAKADGEREIADAEQKLIDARAELDRAAADITDGEKKLSDGEKELADGERDLSDARAEGEEKLAEAEQKLLDAKKKIADAEKEIADVRDGLKLYVFDRSLQPDYAGFKDDCERIDSIAAVFPVFFILVAALVCFTTMTRMVEEQRTEIGTLKALGYSRGTIMAKYLAYASIASVIGGFAGIAVGIKLLPTIIFNTYRMMYCMPDLIAVFRWDYAFGCVGAALACTGFSSLISCYKELVAVPAQLMRPKPPKSGKRIILENIGFIWKRLKFTHKVTVRNLSRYKSRVLMTVVGIAGCTALILTGFGLKHAIAAIVDKQYDEIFIYDFLAMVDSDAEREDKDNFFTAVTDSSYTTDTMEALQKSVDVTSPEKEISAYIFVAEDGDNIGNFITLRERKGHAPLSLTDGSVIINEKLSKLLSLSVGDSVTVDEQEFTVSGICENYAYNYVFITYNTYEKAFGAEDFNIIIGNMTDELLSDDMSKELLSHKCLLTIVYSLNGGAKFADMIKSLDFIVIVIIIAAAALAFVVLYNLANINVNERMRELATIKVLGFYDGEVSAYIYRENTVSALLGTGIGLILGIFLERFVIQTAEVDMVMFSPDLPPYCFVCAAGLTLLFTVIVNLTLHFRLKKIDMAASMKAIE